MNKRYIMSFLFSVVVFSILNIPSIKIFYSNSVINIIVFVLLWAFGIVRTVVIDQGKIVLNSTKIRFLVAFIFMWISMISVTLVRSSNLISLKDYIEYFIVLFQITGLLIFLKVEDVPSIIKMQILWGTLLASLNLISGIKLDSSLGQHYLTLGMPIGASIVSAIGLLVMKENRIVFNPIILIGAFISIIGVTSLRGRTPVILSILVPVIITVLAIVIEKKLMKKLKMSIMVFGVFVLIGWLLYNNLSDIWLNRIYGLLNYQETEPRYRIYMFTIEAIKQNPFGLGLKGLTSYGLAYPHNILLEVMISGGIISGVFFFWIIAIVIKQGYKALVLKSYSVVSLSLFMFYFLTWNLSFDLSSSYIPFAAMVILMTTASGTDINKDENSLRIRL